MISSRTRHNRQYPAVLCLFLPVFLIASVSVQARILEDTTGTSLTQPDPDGPPLSIIIPASDTVSVTTARYRIAGNTDPQAQVFLNDKELTVYPSGAFVGLLDIPPGEYTAVIRAVDREGASRDQAFHFLRTLPASPPAATTEITRTQPDQDIRWPRVAEVQSRRAFLYAGSGTDRLGGARLGFLVKGVRLEVVGREGANYRVRLSDQLEAQIPARFTRLLPEETPLPRSLTGSISVTGHEEHDLVVLSLSERLPYLTRMRTDPALLEIDLFGAVSNTNWITHRETASGIQSVDWEQLASDHFRLRIRLNHEMHWGYYSGYGTGSALRILVRRPPVIRDESRPLQDKLIAIDAGHGGQSRGALGATGTMEKEVVLAISKKLKKILEDQGAAVFMTRETDVPLFMLTRSEMIVASGAHAMVSIHANSIGYASDPDAIRGTSSYYRHVAFQPLSAIVHSHMRKLSLDDFGVIGSFNFTLNALTEMPNTLVETAFISHPEDEMMLINPVYQQKMAEKIARGLADFFLKYGQSEPGTAQDLPLTGTAAATY